MGFENLRVYFNGEMKSRRFGAVVEVDENETVGRVKVEICEQWGLDPRLTSVIRDPEQHENRKPWRIDPARSFLENDITADDRLLLCPSSSTSKICPACLTANFPVDEPATFGASCSRYRCTKCDWRWQVSEKPMAGIVNIEDEMVYVIVDAPDLQGTYHRYVTSNTKPKAIVEYLYRKYGARNAARSGILDLEYSELIFQNKALALEESLANQGIHYSAHLALQTKVGT